jgi:hypothetical protein
MGGKVQLVARKFLSTDYADYTENDFATKRHKRRVN